MLQIISGKFFGDGQIDQAETDAILFSNYFAAGPIKTSVFELRPVDSTDTRIASYVLRFNNRYERAGADDTSALPPTDEVVEQFRLLASFYFQSWFHVNRSSVERLCRAPENGNSENAFPKALIPRFFDLAKTGSQANADGFISFIEKVLSLPRSAYRILISSLTGLFAAMESLEENFDLAYSRMVFMLEALRRSSDLPRPSWEDYDPSLRNKLDEQLTPIDAATADNIRRILLANPHLRLKKRFITFMSSHVTDHFFTDEAQGLSCGLAKSELARALANLYDSRSGYLKEFKRAREQLRLPSVGANTDIFRWNNEPYFTFAGLLRLSSHILHTFIESQLAVAHETCDWRRQLPNYTDIAATPERFIPSADRFQSAQARQAFNAFIQQLSSSFSATGQFRPLDLRRHMEPIENLIPTSTQDRVPLLVLYWMFNGMVPVEHQRPNCEQLISQWEHEVENCSIEFMTMLTLWSSQLPWTPDDCARTFEQYQSSRYKEGATNLPRSVEIAIMAEVAGKFVDSWRIDRFNEWTNRAILDASGNSPLQNYLADRCRLRERADARFILRGAPGYKPLAEEVHATPLTEIDVRLHAYLKWESSGKPENDGVRFWLDSEKELGIAA